MSVLKMLKQLIEHCEPGGGILECDLDAFLKNPTLWRKAAASACTIAPQEAQAFWQDVYDELGIKAIVPYMPALTEKQVKSLDKFGFLLVYIPSISEEDYPESFIKPAWGKYLSISGIERKPLEELWVAVETIAKPDNDDPAGYPDDRLMAAVKRDKRLHTSHDDLKRGLLKEIAEATGFPKKGTRLCTAEEWNVVANLFNYLRGHRNMPLPDLGSTRSSELCENACGSDYCLKVGNRNCGGLADVDKVMRDSLLCSIGFRVLAVL